MTHRHRVSAVVAHPDDETFGMGSLLIDCVERGFDTAVVCATRGEAGELPTGIDDRGSLAEIRERELRAAADEMGVTRVDILGYRDSGMDGEPSPGTLCGTPLEEVADALAAHLDDFRPDVVVTLDGSDGHRDHGHIRDATVRALELTAWSPERVYLHCLPRSLIRQWVERVAEHDPDSPYLALGELGTPEAEITTVVDTSAHLARRKRAIAVHRSQVPPFDAMPPDVRVKFLTAEHLKRIDGGWSGRPEDSIGGE